MINYQFNIQEPLLYHFTGKFRAPNKDWKHLEFPLLDYELIIMTEGELHIGDNQGEYIVKQGEHLLLTPTPNNMRYGIKPSQCSFYWLHFSVDHPILIANQTLSTIEALDSKDLLPLSQLTIPRQGNLQSLEKIVILMKQLQDAFRSGYNTTYLNYMSTIILSELHHQYQSKNVLHTSPQIQLYNDILDYIRLTLSSNLKVSAIANHFGYNEKYLSHLFHNIAGYSLKQYILTELMELAKYKLTDTNDTINQIAFYLSYRDSQNFMKAFKKIVGLTPTEYRNAYSKRLLYDK